MTLTKVEIIEEIIKRVRLSRVKSSESIEILIEIIKRTLESGDDVLISGFGKFCIKDKKERKGRNPSTGKAMMLAPRRVVTFQCSGNLREKVNADSEN